MIGSDFSYRQYQFRTRSLHRRSFDFRKRIMVIYQFRWILSCCLKLVKSHRESPPSYGFYRSLCFHLLFWLIYCWYGRWSNYSNAPKNDDVSPTLLLYSFIILSIELSHIYHIFLNVTGTLNRHYTLPKRCYTVPNVLSFHHSLMGKENLAFLSVSKLSPPIN